MAELMIKLIDKGTSMRPGHVIEVRDDGSKYGNCERPPYQIILKFPGVPKEKFKKYVEPQFGLIGDEQVMLKRRQWRIKLDDMPIAMKDKLLTNTAKIKADEKYTGEYDFDWQQIKSYFYNDVTLKNEIDDIRV